MKIKRLPIGALAITLGLFTQSCQKEDLLIKDPTSSSPVYASAEVTNEYQTAFAKILAKAIKEDREIRLFLKTEALKQIDKDYDVLYQFVSNNKINGEATLRERLLKYADSPTQLADIEKKLPLLTIFIPSLPSGFSAETWNFETQVPVVAISERGNNSVPYYDATGKKEVIEPELTPGFPIVVIKQNERVLAYSANGQSRKDDPLFLSSNEDFSYQFIDQAYNGLNTTASRIPPFFDPTPLNYMDPKVRIAWMPERDSPDRGGAIWQRDFIYYSIGLDPDGGGYKSRGVIDYNYKEYIRSITLSVPALSKISDQTGDPSYIPAKSSLNAPSWVEGYFEFKVQVLNNSKDGTGATYTRIFSARGSDLYDITYQRINSSYYVADQIIPKEFLPFVDIVTWDLQRYGIAWKFYFYEDDPSQTVTSQRTHSSVFASNFEVNASIGAEDTKVGGKFGASLQTTNTQVYTLVTNLDDDFLGEAILNFSDPVVFGGPPQYTYEINTGGAFGYLSASVEPHKWR